jgi:hypothetical protein
MGKVMSSILSKLLLASTNQFASQTTLRAVLYRWYSRKIGGYRTKDTADMV